MSDALAIHKAQRADTVRQIQNTINATLEKGETIIYKNFIIAVSANLSVSRRCSKEYVDDALCLLGVQVEELSDPKFAKLWKDTAESKKELTPDVEEILKKFP